jgi:hypothetical protein
MAAASLVVLAAPASADPISITDATFEWSVNNTMQNPWPSPAATTCHYLSAGASDGSEGAYHAVAGNVAIVKDDATPTWADKCTRPVNNLVNQKVVWSGGTGAVDPGTGAATISFAGTVTLNWNNGASPFTIVDPVFTVGTDGAGSMKATMGGFKSQQGSSVKTPIDPEWTDVTVADLSGVASANTAGFTTTPSYLGVTVNVPVSGTPTNLPTDAVKATNPNWGAWPQSFVDFQYNGSGLTSYWHTSGAASASQSNKAPAPLTIDYGLDTSTDSQTIGVTVPEAPEPGEFVWSIDGNGQVAMSHATDHGDYWGSTGQLQPIVVTDGRAGAPAWSISGQVGDFTGGISGKHLGWTPKVTAAGAGATPGAQVLSGFVSGNGLKDVSSLASASVGHAGGTATLGANLDLRLPISTAAGTYSAVLTITALS